MEVVNIPEKGRGLIATQDHKEGKVLLEEEPICSAQFSWGRKLGYSCCFHCMRALEEPDQCIARLTQGEITHLPENDWSAQGYKKIVPVVCQKTGLSYCSEDCLKKADYNYMRLLIPNWEAVMEVEDLWRDMHFPPEEASIMLIMKILAMRYLEPAMAAKFETFVASEDNSEAHKLLSEKFATTKLLLAVGLQKIFEGLTEEEVSWAFLVCGRNQQGLGTSAIIRWIQAHDDEELVDKLYDTCETTCGLEFMDNEGVGLYALQAMLNHDCEPNAEIKFKHDTDMLSIETTRDIEKGDEICISYLDGCMLNRSKRTRREYLMANYCFHCNCGRCSTEDSADESLCGGESSDEEGEYEEESFS